MPPTTQVQPKLKDEIEWFNEHIDCFSPLETLQLITKINQLNKNLEKLDRGLSGKKGVDQLIKRIENLKEDILAEIGIKRLVKFAKSNSAPWMPFPHGSLVPRMEYNAHAFLSPHLGKLARADLATQETFLGEQMDLFRLSTQTWNHLHPTQEFSHPGDMLLVWRDMAFAHHPNADETADVYSRARIEIRQIRARIRLAHQRQGNRAKPTKKIQQVANPYTPDMFVGIYPKHIQAENPEQINTEATTGPFNQNAFRCHNKWHLLLRFWLKQLHSYHGYIMVKNKTNLRYHRAALELLRRLAVLAPDHLLGRTAAGLSQQHLLPAFNTTNTVSKSVENWYQKLATEEMQVATPQQSKVVWPTAFRPGSIGHPARTLVSALDIWHTLGHPEAEIHAVNQLAHEVACLMTDPWNCNHLAWTDDDLDTIGNNMSENRESLGGTQVKVDSKQFIEPAISATVIFQRYARWASKRMEHLQTALEANS